MLDVFLGDVKTEGNSMRRATKIYKLFWFYGTLIKVKKNKDASAPLKKSIILKATTLLGSPSFFSYLAYEHPEETFKGLSYLVKNKLIQNLGFVKKSHLPKIPNIKHQDFFDQEVTPYPVRYFYGIVISKMVERNKLPFLYYHIMMLCMTNNLEGFKLSNLTLCKIMLFFIEEYDQCVSEYSKEMNEDKFQIFIFTLFYSFRETLIVSKTFRDRVATDQE